MKKMTVTNNIFVKYSNPNGKYTIETFNVKINIDKIRAILAYLSVGSYLSNILQYIVFESDVLKLSMYVSNFFDYVSDNPNEKIIFQEVFKSIKFTKLVPGSYSDGFYNIVRNNARSKVNGLNYNTSGVFKPNEYQNINYKGVIDHLPTSFQINNAKPDCVDKFFDNDERVNIK